jgi:hypothetical protein
MAKRRSENGRDASESALAKLRASGNAEKPATIAASPASVTDLTAAEAYASTGMPLDARRAVAPPATGLEKNTPARAAVCAASANVQAATLEHGGGRRAWSGASATTIAASMAVVPGPKWFMRAPSGGAREE